MNSESITSLLEKAIESRQHLFDTGHESAFRLFNGFTEGNPHLSIDLYAATVIFNNYHADESTGMALVEEAKIFLQNHPRISKWLRAGIVKSRNSKVPEERNGKIIFGERPDRKIKENGIWYAVDLTMNRDASLYLDTRNLRKWLMDNSAGKTVLNAFAYTGSFGVAATAGGAHRVVQLDRNKQFLNLAKDSYSLNNFAIHKSDFITSDFFPAIARFKSTKEFFDCVIVDPPFFSTTTQGKVDQENDSARLINKVRPLINDGGTLIAINNALYVSGKEYLQTLETLCNDGYLKIDELISVPEDFTGFGSRQQITDPAPFNHSTKIAALKVKRKSGLSRN